MYPDEVLSVVLGATCESSSDVNLVSQRDHRYRLLRSYFAQTEHWRTYDPFFTQKQETFSQSIKAIYRKFLHITCVLCAY